MQRVLSKARGTFRYTGLIVLSTLPARVSTFLRTRRPHRPRHPRHPRRSLDRRHNRNRTRRRGRWWQQLSTWVRRYRQRPTTAARSAPVLRGIVSAPPTAPSSNTRAALQQRDCGVRTSTTPVVKVGPQLCAAQWASRRRRRALTPINDCVHSARTVMEHDPNSSMRTDSRATVFVLPCSSWCASNPRGHVGGCATQGSSHRPRCHLVRHVPRQASTSGRQTTGSGSLESIRCIPGVVNVEDGGGSGRVLARR